MLEQGGTIEVVQGGVVSNFLTVPVNSSGEQGRLGLAFDPGYGDPSSAGYRRFFVNHTDPATLDTVVASYRTSTNPLLVPPCSSTKTRPSSSGAEA